ncbi:MAG: hypothetical protein SVJ22_10245 [Halobacteriota archaeon]|nr:hypothetical protein [Halobacteriota archaeon]
MPKCNICGNTFDVDKTPGAILFAPPERVDKACPVMKYHVCRACFDEMKLLD